MLLLLGIQLYILLHVSECVNGFECVHERAIIVEHWQSVCMSVVSVVIVVVVYAVARAVVVVVVVVVVIGCNVSLL